MGCNSGKIETPYSQQHHSDIKYKRMFKQLARASNFYKQISRPNVLSNQELDNITQKLIWDIIQRDSIKQFFFVMQTQGVPINIEIQGKGTYWSLVHLAVRWDAYNCLNYLIKTYFDRNSNDFINFMNLQTLEGYTPLHLAIIWNSLNSFNLLLNYGGIDLSVKDGRDIDIFSMANSYKRTEMKKCLDSLRQLGVNIVSINLQQLQQWDDTNVYLIQSKKNNTPPVIYQYQLDQNSRQYQQIQKFKQKKQQIYYDNQIIYQQLSDDHNNYYNDYYYQQSNQNQQSLQDILNEYRNQGYVIYGLGDEYQGNFLSEQHRKLMEQQQLRQQQLRKKQEEYIFQQQKVRLQKEAEIQKMIEQQKKLQQQKILELKKKQEDKKNNQQTQMQRIIRQQTQLLRKNLEEKKKQLQNQTDDPIQNQIKIDGKQQNTNECPAELRDLYTNLLNSKKNFIDSSFPPKNQSFGTANQIQKHPEWKNVAWLRPSQIFRGNYQLFDGINPDDIKQGGLGTCYYLATLAALAQNQKRIRQLFVFYNKELGFYVVRLYVNGIPKNVVVDDYFPCMRGTNEPIFTRPNGKQIWVMILQKAWCKNFGSYTSAQAMDPASMMEDVQGAPSLGIWIKNPAQQFATMLNYDKLNYIMVLTSLFTNTPHGIQSCHAYSLLDAYNINGLKLLKIRNPWGTYQWNGQYGTYSKKWTPQLKKQVGYKPLDNDGQFFMTPNQLPLGYDYYSIGMVKENYKYTYLNFTSKTQQDLFFAFNIQKKIQVSIRVVQLNDRYIHDQKYKYSPLAIQVYKVNGPQSATFISQGSGSSVFGGKAVLFHQNGYCTLQPGVYNMRIRMYWKNSAKYNTATLVSYSQEAINFSRIQNTQALKNWKNMLRDYMKNVNSSQIGKGLSFSEKWSKSLYVIFVKSSNNKDCEVTFTYKPNDFKNMCLGLKKKDNDKLVMKIRKLNGSNVATIQRIGLNEAVGLSSYTTNIKQL